MLAAFYRRHPSGATGFPPPPGGLPTAGIPWETGPSRSAPAPLPRGCAFATGR
jgi:hypothetical protein